MSGAHLGGVKTSDTTHEMCKVESMVGGVQRRSDTPVSALGLMSVSRWDAGLPTGKSLRAQSV